MAGGIGGLPSSGPGDASTADVVAAEFIERRHQVADAGQEGEGHVFDEQAGAGLLSQRHQALEGPEEVAGQLIARHG